MIHTPGPDLFVSVIDLIFTMLAAGLLIFILPRGWLKSASLPVHGRVLLLTGVFLAVSAHVVVVVIQSLHSIEAAPLFVLSATPAWLGWLLWLASRIGFVMIAAGLLAAVIGRKNAVLDSLDVHRELEVSKYFEYQAEERFRYLFDSTSNSVYCFRFDPPVPVDLPVAEQLQGSYDAILQDCNVNFARELGVDDPSEVLGSRLGDFDSAKDTASHEAYFKAFIDGHYKLDGYELNYKSPDGAKRSLLINVVGVIRDGLLHRMWAVENNILAIREAQASLAGRQAFQSLVAKVSSRLVMATDEDAYLTVEDCMGVVCEYIGAERSTVFWFDENAETADFSYVYSAVGNPFDTSPQLDRFPQAIERLMDLQPVRIDNVQEFPEEYDVDKAGLDGFDLQSLVVLPLVVDRKPVGGVTFSRVTFQKDWSDQDLADLAVFAELFASHILRHKSRRALNEALRQLKQATERLEAENVYLRQEIELTHGFDEFIGRSDAVLRSLRLVEKVAPTNTPVLIMGETGTGKELVARALHELSDRCDHPLVKVNCAALPANLIESELFGHEKGAFTGADSAKRGRFDLAHGSTLFLDEIGEIPIELQAKLLRVLQEGEFDRLGGGTTIKVDVRLIVATNRNLAEAVRKGEFRSDLFYRINTFPIELPALRDRDDDIQLLAEHFVNMHAPRFGREVSEISSEMMIQLRRYPWPGNVRELEGIVQRALISSNGPVLNLAEPLVVDPEDDERSASSSVSDLKLVEREHIVAVLEDASWKISGDAGAATKLGIPPSTLRSKMKKLSIVRPN